LGAKADDKASLAEFFYLWSKLRGWTVPDIHWRAVHWMEHRGDLAVLRCFRGFGKSTLLAIYNAWRYYRAADYRILHQGDQDGTAHKTARDTKAVLERHPLTRDLAAGIKGEISFWWVPGSDDERNPSMQAAGILSNITSSRADEVQNDDVEVPKNITTPEAREKLRYRLGEQTHILVPGGRKLYIGTPHTHDSLYDEMERMGADCLTIRMYEREQRIERASEARHAVQFRPDVVFSGIGEAARVLKPGAEYTWKAGWLTLLAPDGSVVDCYAGSAWPERFDAAEMLIRRRACRTLNEWDSQYQLHAKPITDTRLDPDRLEVYDIEPIFRRANGETVMMLGNARIVGATLRWDPSSGKLTSDVSAVAVVLQDEDGCRYVHRIERLLGDVATFSEDGKTITGGQVLGLCNLVRQFSLPRITIETNGIGKFSPAIVKAALKQQGLKGVGVKEEDAVQNKNRRILEALEPLFMTAGQLWVHQSVIDGPMPNQAREWNPAVREQPDDYLDVLAGAVTESPERMHRFADTSRIPDGVSSDHWRPSAGVHDVVLT
jgi:hypothetical protein